MVIPPLLALVLAVCFMAPFAGWWSLLPAAALLAADAAATRVRLLRRKIPIGFASLLNGRLRALGSLLYYLCYHLVRYYAAPLLIIALVVPGFRSWALPASALLCAAGVDYLVKRPKLAFIRFIVIYLLEQLAYGSGVFWGCLRRKCFSSYRVVILKHMEATA
jgi:hypothetical protein